MPATCHSSERYTCNASRFFFWPSIITETYIETLKWVGIQAPIAMAKRVTHAVEHVREGGTFGLDKVIRRIACDDGTTYEFRKELGTPRWRSYARYGADGDRSIEPSRLPAAVEAHMDGRTCSGPRGEDSDEYWV